MPNAHYRKVLFLVTQAKAACAAFAAANAALPEPLPIAANGDVLETFLIGGQANV